MKNLAPQIFRQRLIIEGLLDTPIDQKQIKQYLTQLSGALKMKTLIKPVTHKSPKFGWAGWIHWETSGAHFYAWDRPLYFFSVDIYTCKAFDSKKAIDFTKKFFKPKALVYKSI